MVKFKENDLLENKGLRETLIERLDVLEKVKGLLLLPNTDIATTKQVAEYFEVDKSVIDKATQRNREELESSGLKFLKYGELKELLNMDNMSTLKISRQGTNVFNKRAILNLAMLLRDSKVAKEVRQALLDQQEVISDEQKTNGISEEERLLLNIMKAKDVAEQAIAVSELNNYKNRHIAELNVNIERMKPKEEAFDKFIDASNYQTMKQASNSLNVGRNKMFQFLRDNKILTKDNLPYQTYIDREWFVVKQTPVNKGGFITTVSQTFVTPKGINGMSKLLHKQ